MDFKRLKVETWKNGVLLWQYPKPETRTIFKSIGYMRIFSGAQAIYLFH